LRSRFSMRIKNVVSGALVGGWYAASCYIFFGRDLPAGNGSWVVLGFTLVGIWYAVASGLNQVFAKD
jgi:hypothetical protein